MTDRSVTKQQRIQPEHIRRKAMNDYADLQKFKLKVAIAIGLFAWAAHGFPGWLS